jgi:hypothetical protein
MPRRAMRGAIRRRRSQARGTRSRSPRRRAAWLDADAGSHGGDLPAVHPLGDIVTNTAALADVWSGGMRSATWA